jgi:hypothetical protein
MSGDGYTKQVRLHVLEHGNWDKVHVIGEVAEVQDESDIDLRWDSRLLFVTFALPFVEADELA